MKFSSFCEFQNIRNSLPNAICLQSKHKRSPPCIYLLNLVKISNLMKTKYVKSCKSSPSQSLERSKFSDHIGNAFPEKKLNPPFYFLSYFGKLKFDDSIIPNRISSPKQEPKKVPIRLCLKPNIKNCHKKCIYDKDEENSIIEKPKTSCLVNYRKQSTKKNLMRESKMTMRGNINFLYDREPLLANPIKLNWKLADLNYEKFTHYKGILKQSVIKLQLLKNGFSK